MIQAAIAQLIAGNHLTAEEAERVMDEIMTGEATPAQIGGYLVALRIKGETPQEIAGSVRSMRGKATRVETRHELVVDTAGTGGDGAHTFNISTTAALAVAAAGAPVAKHGNRAVSSACGSADLLKALGVNIEAPPERVSRCIDEVGFGFLFAPLLHGAMKHAIGPRRELAARSIFNIMGPLTNPAGAKCQLIGVYDPSLTELMATVLGELGSHRAMVVHGSDGIDEITITGPTRVSELKDGKVKTYELRPEDVGLGRADGENLKGGDPPANARLTREVLGGAGGPRRDVVLLNAAAALYVGERAKTLEEGVELAARAIDSGGAREKLEALIEASNR
ncbi:MAG: anthranilate phosphoribosyltransferase [Nitrospinota bacterium]